MGKKTCTKCEQEKDIGLFVKKSKSPDGYASECKECHNNHNRSKYNEDIEGSRAKGRETVKRYIKNHPEKKAACAKRYYTKYPERVAARYKAFYDIHREEIINRSVEYYKLRPDKAKEEGRKHYKKHRVEILAKKKIYGREHRNEHNIRNRKRMATNLQERIAHNLRSRISVVINGRSKGGRLSLLLGCSMTYFITHIESQFTLEMGWHNYGKSEGTWCLDHVIPVALFDLNDEEQQKCAFSWCNIQPMWYIENCSKGSSFDGSRHYRKAS